VVALDATSTAPIFADLERYLPAAPAPHTLVTLPSGESRVLTHSRWPPENWRLWENWDVQRPDRFQSLCLSFIGLTVADTIMTAQALHDGSGRELNPVLAPFAQNTASLIATKAAIDVTVMYLAKKIRRTDEKSAINVMIAANALSGIAVIQNVAAPGPQTSR
jgi:hypothetical protein